jgi:hypothetical protein
VIDEAGPWSDAAPISEATAGTGVLPARDGVGTPGSLVVLRAVAFLVETLLAVLRKKR